MTGQLITDVHFEGLWSLLHILLKDWRNKKAMSLSTLIHSQKGQKAFREREKAAADSSRKAAHQTDDHEHFW